MKLDSETVRDLRERFAGLPAQYDLLVIVVFACIYVKLGIFTLETFLQKLNSVDDTTLGLLSAFIFGLDGLAVVSYIQEVHPRIYHYISSGSSRS